MNNGPRPSLPGPTEHPAPRWPPRFLPAHSGSSETEYTAVDLANEAGTQALRRWTLDVKRLYLFLE